MHHLILLGGRFHKRGATEDVKLVMINEGDEHLKPATRDETRV